MQGNERIQDKNEKEKAYAPYLDGASVSTDNGPILSVFALQEIMQKIRQNQSDMAAHAPDVDGAIPEVMTIISGIKGLLEEKDYKVINAPPNSFRTIPMQSTEYVLQVNTFYERMSEIGGPVDETDPIGFYALILEKLKFLKSEGAFILQGIATKDYRGAEIADPEIIGVSFQNALSHLAAIDRQIIQDTLNGMIIENGLVADRNVDVFRAAMSDPIYRIHNVLQGYIEGIQYGELRESVNWLMRLGLRKRIEFANDFLTDFRRADTIWIISQRLPINANVIWNVPRCHIANLITNVALCLPTGEYLMPNPRINSITITQRITQTNPFSIISGLTPTAVQMNDVRKIYLALMFPNQIILDIKPDSSHAVDPVLRMVAGVLGHVMFTYGPIMTNITPTMAELLDAALSDYLLYMYNNRIPINYGPTGQPLDFRIGARNQYDCNAFRADPQTGRGYNGWGVVDVQRVQPSPYDHVQRVIRYCDIDSREIIDPRTYGMNMTYPIFREMLRMLVAAGKDQEAAYLRQMLPFHMIRFARINQIINEDLLSAFSLPDQNFDVVLHNLIQGNFGETDPVVLEVSWASIWFAFVRRFEPIARSDLLEAAPLIEARYAAELSTMQMDVQQLRMMRARVPDTVINATPSQCWKAVLKNAPEPIKNLMNLSHSFSFVNVRDIVRWSQQRDIQESLAYVLNREAWAIANDFEDLMLVDHVYIQRTMLPEPRLDDINEFRRQGFFHTNVIDGAPPIGDVTHYTYAIANLQANMGQFRAAIRRTLDDNGWIQFGGMLRNIKIKFFDSRPPDEILTAMPYVYTEEERDGVRMVAFKYATTATAYFLLYNVEYSNTPDTLITVNPTFTMTKIHMRKKIVRRVRAPDVLSQVNKRLVAYKGKMRLMDVTKCLKTGVQLARPTI
ncbi:inner core protein [African horse sickness virus 5]|uniref:Inner core protein n=1 Tax=African horse sickness virus 5 TaxID=86059 RepID=A0A189RMH3_AHSV5|nr:inner core protein [African horse sickness virus 5]